AVAPPPAATDVVPVFLSEPNVSTTARGSKVAFVAPPRAEIATPEMRPARADGRTSAVAGRVILVAGVLMLLVTAGYAGYKQFLRPTSAPLSTNTTMATGPTAPSDAASTRPAVAGQSGLPWRPIVASAQQAIASDNLKGAFDLLSEAFDKGGHT